MNIWEQAAEYLVKAPVEVRVVEQFRDFMGEAYLKGDTRRIDLSPDLNNDQRLDVFCMRSHTTETGT